MYVLGVGLVSLAQGAMAWAAASLLGALAGRGPSPLGPAVVGAAAALGKVGLSGWVAREEVSL